MKTILIILLFSVNSFAGWSLFDGIYKKIDDNSTKTYKVADDISAIREMNNTLVGKIDKLEMRLEAQAQVQASAIAGVNNRINHTQTNTSAGRDNTQTQSSVNDSAIFIRYVEAQEKLSKVYEKIIIILIGQLCGLLTLFVKKDWDMAKRLSEKDEKINGMLIKIIGDDAAREDMSNNLNGKSIVNAQIKQEVEKIESVTEITGKDRKG